MGRPRKPIQDHLRSGHYRPSRHGPLPAPAVGPPAPPAKPRGLSKEASRLWDRLVVDLADILRPVDGIMLEVLVRGWSLMKKVETEMEKHEIGSREYLRLLRAASRLADQFLGLCDKFGMSPLARRKLGVVDAAPTAQRVPTRPKTRLDREGPPPGFEGSERN